MIIHDDGEREDLELDEIKACVLPVKEPFRWPAKEDVNKRLSGSSRSVDLSPPRSTDDETVSVQLMSSAKCAPTSAQDANGANGADAMVPPRRLPATAPGTVAQALFSGSAVSRPPLAARAECGATTLQLV